MFPWECETSCLPLWQLHTLVGDSSYRLQYAPGLFSVMESKLHISSPCLYNGAKQKRMKLFDGCKKVLSFMQTVIGFIQKKRNIQPYSLFFLSFFLNMSIFLCAMSWQLSGGSFCPTDESCRTAPDGAILTHSTQIQWLLSWTWITSTVQNVKNIYWKIIKVQNVMI